MAGIIDMPMPKPRTTIAAPSSQKDVCRVDQDEGERGDDHDRAAHQRRQPAAEALGDAAGEGHRERRADALRDQQQAGDDGVLAAHELEVQRHQDHAAEQRGAEAEGRHRRGRERLVGVQADVEQRVLDVQRADDEGGDQREAGEDGDEHLGGEQRAGGAALGEAVGDADEAGGDEREAGGVEPAGVAPARPRRAAAGAARR